MKLNYFIYCLFLALFSSFCDATAQVKIIETIAGTGTAGYNSDGIGATAAEINANYFLALDAAGNLYFADYSNNRVREIYTNGIIATIAGITGPGGYSADNVPASTSKLNSPEGVAVDAAGNIYIGDYLNNRIRKVTASTGVITTIAGTGTPGYTGDGAAATLAEINSPRGVAVDAAGNVYFADGGATTLRVRMISASTNFISTIAGDATAGYTTDGVVATTTDLNAPRGVYVDGAGNVYIADMSNNRIRKVTPGALIISTVAGSGTAGYGGDGGPATVVACEIDAPTDARMDAAGNLYIADVTNNRIRLVNGTTDNITTIAGAGGAGAFAGDGGPATAARFNSPVAIAISPNGNYYISDRSNNRIRIVRNNSTPYFVNGTHQSITVCENSSANSITSLLSIIDSDNLQTETWSIPLVGTHGAAAAGTTTATSNAGTLATAGSWTYTPNIGYSGQDTFHIQISDGYASSVDTFYVTVNPLPVVAAITGAATNVCVGAELTLFDATGGGAWSSTANATVVSGSVFGVTAGTATISYTVTNACGPTSSLYSLTVNPLPNAGSVVGLSTVCVGGSINLSDAAPGGAWTSSTGAASVVNGTVTGVSAGTSNISYTVVNSCGTAAAALGVTVVGMPNAGSIAGSTTVCVGSSINLTDGVGGGTWSSGSASASVVNGTVTGVSAGTSVISYNVTNVCYSASATSTITVNPLPVSGVISGSTSVCLGTSTTLTDAAPGGTWSSPSATVSVGSVTGMVTGLAGGTATISYTVTNVCGTSQATYPISIISIPTAGTITGPGTLCQGASVFITDPVPLGIWSSSNATATVGSSNGYLTGVTGGTDIITYSVSYSCGSAYTTYSVTINPLPSPGFITGPSIVCIGGGASYTITGSGGAWSMTNGNATITTGGLVSSVSPGLDTVKYSVTNSCGTVAAIFPISINAIVTPSVSISAMPGFTTCPGTLVTYTATPVYGGSSPTYQWTVNGVLIASLGNVVYAPVNGDTIVVTLISDASCTSASTVTDTVRPVVNPNVAPHVTISTGIYGISECVGTLTPFTATPDSAGTTPTYQWLVNGVAAGTGNPYSYTPTNGDMVTCIITSDYACALPATATSNTVTMTMNTTETPSLTITATPGGAVCAGTNVLFTAVPIFGGIAPEFRWTRNGVNVATGPTFHYAPNNGDRVYCMLSSSEVCRTLDSVFSNTIDITANPNVVPVVSISVTTDYISVGQVTTFTAHVTGTTLPTYQWYVNGSSISGATNSTYMLTGAIAGTEIVNCLASSTDPCHSTVTSNGITVTVNDLGVAQASGNTSLRLSPNPNKGIFTLEAALSPGATARIEITDILGRVIYSQPADVSNGILDQHLNLTTFASGMYLLHLTTGKQNEVIRFAINQ